MFKRLTIPLALATIMGISPALATPSFFGRPESPDVGTSVLTPRGEATVTGSFGSTATTVMPGNGGQGFLMSNGNGTSTLLVPGGVPQVVPTPR